MSKLTYKVGDTVNTTIFDTPVRIFKTDPLDSNLPYFVGFGSGVLWIQKSDITSIFSQEKPTVREKQQASITDWRIDKRERTHVLVGTIKYHEMHPEGTEVVTTALLWIDFKNHKAETRNTVYRLL